MVPLSAKVWYNKPCSLDFQFQQLSAAVLPEVKKSNDRELITFNTSIIPLDGLMAKYERAAVDCINHEVFNNSGLPQTLFAISDSNKTGYDGLSMFVKDPLNKDATLNAERTALSADTKRTHVWLHVFRLGSLVYL